MDTATTEITSMGTAKTFLTKGTCSQTLMRVLDHAYGQPMEAEERAVDPLAGGIAQQGYQCGQLWGASLAAGAQAHRLHGDGPKAEAAAVHASRRVVEAFEAQFEETNCLELTETDWLNKGQMLRYMLKGGPIRCGGMAVRYAPVALAAIDEALAEEPPETASPCASCAARMVRMMGGSEQHAVMAAGLAGGIGLSGGACGALGAAVWYVTVSHPEEKYGFSPEGTRIGAMMDRFLAASDHQFECSIIVGRTFEDVDDHARHVAAGGCDRILEVLAGVEEIADEDAA